jgi:quercetin dioxygenase-like cupin family protein
MMVVSNMMTNPYLQDTLEDKAVIFGPKQGEVLRIKGGSITFKVTSSISNDQLGVYEIYLEPGVVGAQLHYHRYMDETFIVNDGTLTVQHGSARSEAAHGSVIYVPRFTPHGFANNSDKPVTLTLIFNPAQKREGFFFGLVKILGEEPVNAKDFLTLYNKYDSFPVDEKNMLPHGKT